MSLSNKKFLISGCGFSWSYQERKTWVNVLRSVGVDVTDTGGPAVSNQWIINRAFQQLLTGHYDHVVIQITGIGKLDVEILSDREDTLVKSDTIRNFIIDGVWPSSYSRDHLSKALYEDFLVSPKLETEDLYCKLLMLDNWCRTHEISLTVLQAYPVPWTTEQYDRLSTVIHNIGDPLYDQYVASSSYQYHDHSNNNSVPCIQYHCKLANTVAKLVVPDVVEQIIKIQNRLSPEP